MNIGIKRRLNQAVTAVALFCTVMQPTYALTLATQPLFLGPAVPPQVMLALSKDQQLYKKAYNDYSDLDGDGDPETTYKHSVTYYGYFDPIKCYAYTAANQFEPVSITTFTVPDLSKTPAATKPGSAYCDDSTGRWSGNFLNWISMSRMDAVRKLLYGGMRQVDSQTDTVLERAFIPTDAHAWAKYYNGPDVAKLTPFTTITTPFFNNENTTSNVLIEKKAQDLQINFSNGLSYVALGDQLRMEIRGKPTQYIMGAVMALANSNKTVTVRIDPAGISGEGNSDSKWTVTNLSSTGISFCNLTPGTSGPSQSNTNAPVIRAVRGNFALWNANELWQCQWSEDRNFSQAGFNGVRSNGNQASLSEINASAENPSRAFHGLGGSGTTQGQYVARVKVCVSAALKGTENCAQYPQGNLKPVGLLQQFGEDNSIHFGLMTGSYAKNISGGVLRKNVGTFTDEVDQATYGTFTNVNGIVATVNKMRIYGYDYGGGTYLPASPAGDNCTYQLTSITENSCTSWGNPMSEIYFEAIRYFASTNQPTPAYTYTSSGSKDASLVVPNGAPAGSVAGLPLPAWNAPISQTNVCSKLNVLVFNASVSSNDDDLGNTVAVNANNKTVRELTNTVGDLEGITNGNYFIGKRTSDNGATAGFELCTAKTVTALGDVSGICPEGPTLGGSYLLAGLAYQARTQKIRNDLNAAGDADALKVMSYGIQLATNTPQLTIPIPGKPGQKVVIQPTYRLDLGSGNYGGGSIVDMKYVRQSVVGSVATGKVYINWEDSEQGGDYDQDMWGTLEWTLDAASNKLTITTYAISASSLNPQGFGYTVSGTTQDGPHFHSGIYGFLFTDPTGVRGCATRCRHPTDPNVTPLSQIGPQSWTYDIDTSRGAANSLNDPLWYLAKYGGFVDANRNGQLDPGEWDSRNNVTGDTSAGDGVPDNYFLVTNPLGLDDSLRKVFLAITSTGSASAVAANSTSLKTGAAVFAGRFNSKDWSGQLAAFKLTNSGTIDAQQSWDAGQLLPSPSNRLVLTYLNTATARKGIPFRWPGASPNPNTDISPTLVNALNTMPENTTTQDGRGSLRLDYLRGDGSNEGVTTNAFRQRTRSKLGDIANSNPVYVPPIPNDVVLDASYKTFRDGFIKQPRPAMVYVGANDGMLHGFEADVTSGGKERLAYVPSKTFANLNQLTNKSYVHRYYVDGSPTVNDAFVNNSWKTVLVGALASGGRGLFALDVTNPPPADGTAATELASASKVLWEFNAEDDVGVGYVLGQPLIRKMANNRWAAIVSGGYNNNEAGATKGDGKGYIFIIFLDGPTGNSGRTWQPGIDYIRLDTGTGNDTTPNGVAPPYTVDMNLDGKADIIYAGDLLGTLWKFDVSSTNPSLWTAATNRVALYKGDPTQPITGAVEAVIHPTSKGLIVMFGTGKYLEPSDPVAAVVTPPATPFKKQSFYGIWDKNDGNTVSLQTVVTNPATELFQQTINLDTSGTFRYMTGAGGATGPDWTKHLGWFMDFPNSAQTGERNVAGPLVVSRRLLFTTITPGTGACDGGGTSFLMIVNPSTGGGFTTPVLDVTGDGFLTAGDVVSGKFFASGIQTSGIITRPALFSGTGTRSDSTLLNSDNIGRVSGGTTSRAKNAFWCNSKAICTNLKLGFGPDSGRATWREVVKK